MTSGRPIPADRKRLHRRRQPEQRVVVHVHGPWTSPQGRQAGGSRKGGSAASPSAAQPASMPSSRQAPTPHSAARRSRPATSTRAPRGETTQNLNQTDTGKTEQVLSGNSCQSIDDARPRPGRYRGPWSCFPPPRVPALVARVGPCDAADANASRPAPHGIALTALLALAPRAPHVRCSAWCVRLAACCRGLVSPELGNPSWALAARESAHRLRSPDCVMA